MSRSSPGVRRVAAILNFIASHPGKSFALTDLVRALKLSRATCHALLTGLVEVGYLFRTGDKTYVLGPALAAIGRTAADHFSPLQVAQPEMRSIADEFDVVCGAYFLEGDIMHLRDRAASVSHVSYPVPLGTRMQLRSALAPAFFARSPAEAEAWLARANPRPAPERLEAMEQAMEFARRHGFVALSRNPGVSFEAQQDRRMELPDSDDLPVMVLPDVDPASIYPIGAIMAPVMETPAKVCFVLVMAGFHAGMTGEGIMQAGERLRAACDRISRFVAGQAEAA